jgi:dihydrofolate synthase/folylpolyglutamate synthase
MTYPEAIQFLYDLRMFGAKFGLENTRRLAELAGNPQHRLRFVHVAGTNGKGSTCAMLESIYRAAGLRVGLFTSPHLVSFAERIQVNRQLIPELEVVRLVEEMRVLRERLGDSWRPTFFEVVTVMALRYFDEQHCDLVVWETGLGGRLDATNIVTPLASVITNIGFDHQQWLGNTLDKIAGEKAGIIKPGVPLITAAEPGRGLEVILETAHRLKAPATVVGQASSLSRTFAAQASFITAEEAWPPAVGSKISKGPALSLSGPHQELNAALAMATVRALSETLPVTAAAIRAGLAQIGWPGRMQVIKSPDDQTIVLDGAHNADSAQALATAFRQQFPNVHPTLILGVLADKDWHAIATALAPLAGRFLLVPVNTERTLAPEKLLAVCQATHPKAIGHVCASLAEALEASASDPFLLVTGSLYLVGEALERLHLLPRPPADERALNEWSASRPR